MAMCIISGPSSVGKSFFIESGAVSKVSGFPEGTPTLFPYDADSCYAEPRDVYMHYNILRLAHILPKPLKDTRKNPMSMLYQWIFNQNIGGGSGCWRYMRDSWLYTKDQELNNILKLNVKKQAIVLVSDKKTILNRIKKRRLIEGTLPSNYNDKRYPTDYWEAVYQDINLLEVYTKWCMQLEAENIEYKLINSMNSQYKLIKDKELLGDIIR